MRAAQALDEGGLACAIGAEQGHAVAGIERKVEVLQQGAIGITGAAVVARATIFRVADAPLVSVPMLQAPVEVLYAPAESSLT